VQPDRSVPTRSFRRLVQAGWARYIEGRIRGWGDSSRLKFRRNSFPLVSNGKLLQKNPELRYQTAAELRDDLQRLAEGSPKARRGGKLGITVMAVVVAAAIGVLLWQHMQAGCSHWDGNTGSGSFRESTRYSGKLRQSTRSPHS
jgi:hypothetical protein